MIGTLYSILTAFIIFVVWDQFNKLGEVVYKESRTLKDIVIYVSYMNDPDSSEKIKSAVRGYASAVLQDGWTKLQLGERSVKVGEESYKILEVIKKIKFDDSKDSLGWENSIKKYEELTDAREQRIALATSRIPPMLKFLLYFVSASLVMGFFILGVENNLIATLITAVTTTMVFLVIEVIKDLDDPFTGKWSISLDPYKSIIEN